MIIKFIKDDLLISRKSATDKLFKDQDHLGLDVL